MTKGRLSSVTLSKLGVEMPQRSASRAEGGRRAGRWWKKSREEAKRVKPVSAGEGVRAVKSWNLILC